MKIWVLIAMPFFMIALAVAAALSWDFKSSSGPLEKVTAAMSLEGVAAPPKLWDLSKLKGGPFRTESAASSSQPGINKRARGRGGLRVALIVIGGKKSIAMIDGRVMTTGDSINGLMVKRIEKERVLLAGKKKFWRYLENR